MIKNNLEINRFNLNKNIIDKKLNKFYQYEDDDKNSSYSAFGSFVRQGFK